MEGTVIEKVEWRSLFGGKGKENLNKEVKWRPLHGGVEKDENLNEEVKRRPLDGGARGGKFKSRSKMETIYGGYESLIEEVKRRNAWRG